MDTPQPASYAAGLAYVTVWCCPMSELSLPRLLAIFLGTLLVPLSSMAAAPEPTGNASLHETHWVAQTLDGAPLAPGAAPAAHLVLHARSQHLSGFAGCNRLRGRYTQRGTQIALSALSATRMACPAAQMQQEQQFMALLGSADAYRIEGRTLSLLQGDVVRVTFTATRSK